MLKALPTMAEPLGEEQPSTERHAYVEGVGFKTGKDGRTYRLCRVCGNAANTGLHRGHRTTPPTPAEQRARTDAHAFVRSEHVRVIANGKRLPLCERCGDIQQGRVHRIAPASRPEPLALAPSTVQLTPLQQPSVAARQQAASPSAAPRRAPARIVPPPAELALVAIGIDRLLALPGDSISWRLRVALVGARQLIKVPVLPTLDESAQLDDEAAPPTEADLEKRPELRQLKRPPAPETITRTVISGIRHDRTRRLAERAIRQGWQADKTGSGHLLLTKGDARLILSMTSNGQGRGWANARAQAKRLGIDVAGL